MGRFRVVAVIAATVLGAPWMVASCKSNNISSSTAEGRTVTGPDGVTLLLPAGAVPPEVEITIKEATPGSYPAKADLKGKVYAIEPHGTQFATAATLQMPAPPGAKDGDVMIWKAEVGGQWGALSKDMPAVEGGKISASVTDLSYFAVGDCMIAGQSCMPPMEDGGFPDGGFGGPGSSGGPPTGSSSCDMNGAPWKVDTTVKPGTASLSGTWETATAGTIDFSTLTHGCATNYADLVLHFADSDTYCQGLVGGEIDLNVKHAEISLGQWSQASNPNFQSGSTSVWTFPTAGQAPMCSGNVEWSNQSPIGLFDPGDGGAPTAGSVKLASGKVSGNVSITVNGGSVVGTFTDFPLLDPPSQTAQMCCIPKK